MKPMSALEKPNSIGQCQQAAHREITDKRIHRPKADICIGRSNDEAVDRVAAQAVGRDRPVTGSPACYRLAVVSDLRVRRKSEIPIQTIRIKLLAPLKPFLYVRIGASQYPALHWSVGARPSTVA
jgi:hypothetical protein